MLELKKNPNPNEKDCDDFIRIIREHEAVMNSRGYREDGRKNTVKTVKKDEDTKADPPRPPHALCGLTHGKREWKYKYSTPVKPRKVGELQRKGDREEIEKERIGIGKIREVRLEVVREEEIEVRTDVVSLQNMIRETSRLNPLETESRK